jgi:hypothetical protein
MNVYLYVKNNPINHIDPLGLFNPFAALLGGGIGTAIAPYVAPAIYTVLAATGLIAAGAAIEQMPPGAITAPKIAGSMPNVSHYPPEYAEYLAGRYKPKEKQPAEAKPADATTKAENGQVSTGVKPESTDAVRTEARGDNKLKPDPKATGEHTTFKRDPVTGKVTGHQTWKPQTNPKDPKPWEPGPRTDVTGAPHHDKATGQTVPTPHTHEADGTTRPAKPEELPK